MSGLPKQTTRAELIARFKELGFQGPRTKGTGGPHPSFMQRGSLKVGLPNPHGKDIGQVLLRRILKQAGLTTKEWLGD